jgi:transposase
MPDLYECLADRPRSGRPATAQGIIDPLLEAVIDDDPRDWGYPATVWTAPLLRQFLRDRHGLMVSTQSVRLAIARLEILWKRPRHRLAQRPEAWRQAKGGFSAACAAACARSC